MNATATAHFDHNSLENCQNASSKTSNSQRAAPTSAM